MTDGPYKVHCSGLEPDQDGPPSSRCVSIMFDEVDFQAACRSLVSQGWRMDQGGNWYCWHHWRQMEMLMAEVDGQQKQMAEACWDRLAADVGLKPFSSSRSVAVEKSRSPYGILDFAKKLMPHFCNSSRVAGENPPEPKHLRPDPTPAPPRAPVDDGTCQCGCSEKGWKGP